MKLTRIKSISRLLWLGKAGSSHRGTYCSNIVEEELKNFGSVRDRHLLLSSQESLGDTKEQCSSFPTPKEWVWGLKFIRSELASNWSESWRFSARYRDNTAWNSSILHFPKYPPTYSPQLWALFPFAVFHIGLAGRLIFLARKYRIRYSEVLKYNSSIMDYFYVYGGIPLFGWIVFF